MIQGKCEREESSPVHAAQALLDVSAAAGSTVREKPPFSLKANVVGCSRNSKLISNFVLSFLPCAQV